MKKLIATKQMPAKDPLKPTWTKQYKPTAHLTYENVHVPVSVSIGDIIEREPTHLCNGDTKA